MFPLCYIATYNHADNAIQTVIPSSKETNTKSDKNENIDYELYKVFQKFHKTCSCKINQI